MNENFKKIIDDFSICMKNIDTTKPVYQSVRKSATVYKPGIGPHIETKTVKMVVEEMKKINNEFYKESYHLTCTYSKLNKTYYLENFKRGEFGGVGISFKSKNKLSVLRKMEQLKKMTIKFKNEKNRN